MSCSLAAIATKKGSQEHRKYGRYFFYGMTGVFLTAIPMAVIKSNLFLFLIAVFSYYLAYSGLRYARRRELKPSKLDWLVCLIMVMASISMIMTGLLLYDIRTFQGQVLIVFGLLGASFSLNDFRLFTKGSLPYPIRISRHLAAMLGGTIAAYTAFLVTNVPFNPPIVLWLGPTVLITPLIVYWTNKVERKQQ
jgi:hypothetical protein